MSELNTFLIDELLTNRIIVISNTVYKRNVTDRQIAYVRKCVDLMCAALKQHVTDWDETEFTLRENKIIESLSGSFISAALRIAFLLDEVDDLKRELK